MNKNNHNACAFLDLAARNAVRASIIKHNAEEALAAKAIKRAKAVRRNMVIFLAVALSLIAAVSYLL